MSRLAAKADGYRQIEAIVGVPWWLLVVVPGSRREAGARAALADSGLAAATTTHAGVLRPAEAVWAPLGADGHRMRLAGLADWPRPAASYDRLAEAARLG